MRKAIWLALAAIAAAQLAGQTGKASIQGRIIDEDGKRIAKAAVSANVALENPSPFPNLPSIPPVPTGRQVASTVSAQDGSFLLTGLPAGKLVLCGQVAGFVDPCHWSGRVPTITLSDGQASTGFEIRLKKGSVLRVRLNDPGKLLDATLTDDRKRLVVVNVISPRRLMYPALLASKDGSGRNYEATVPFDTALQLIVVSRDVEMEDQAGSAVPLQGRVTNFVHTQGADNARPHTFHVLRTRP